MRKSKRRKVEKDGYLWIPKEQDLWADYPTASEYQGIENVASFRNYVCRHELRTIRHGRRKLVCKADLDRLSGVGRGGDV
jgi:hypothetical protein